MNDILKSFTLSAAAVAVLAAPAAAQTGWGSLGLFGSYLRGGDLAEVNDANEFGLDNDMAYGLTLEGWFGQDRRWGLRLDGSYADAGFDPEAFATVENDVNVWQGDLNLMFRPWAALDERVFLPFLSAGAGFVHWDPADPLLGVYDTYQVEVADDQSEFAFTLGLGTDIFLSDNLSLRLEAKDYMYGDSPYFRTDGAGNVLDEDHDGGHNFQARIGFNFFWGGQRVREPGFIDDEPEPLPAPQPQPEPEPVEETIAMCVVDDAYGLTTVDVIRDLETGQLWIVRNGRRMAFDDAYPAVEPRYVENARWYVEDRPLTIYLDEDDMGGDLDDELDDAAEQLEDSDATRLEFVLFGSPGQRNARDLTFVGTVGGTPIYANTGDVRGFQARLRQHFATNTDLEVILPEDADLASEFGNVRTFYVPVGPDCVFAPVSSVYHVRRTRG